MNRTMPVAAAELPMPIDVTVELASHVTELHGPDCYIMQRGKWLVFYTPGEVCGCGTCWTFEHEAITRLTGDSMALTTFMILCPDCGNKRCPQAGHHDYACTGSNATDQIPELKAVVQRRERDEQQARDDWFHPRHEPRFESCPHHCRHRKCKDTNWQGRDRVHSRFVDCPPNYQESDPACPDCTKEST